MRKKINDYILTASFMTIIFSVGICNELSEKKDTSFIENRSLAQKPEFSIENIKDFTVNYEKYYSDQFLMREDFLKAYTALQLKLKKSVIQDIYVNNDWLLGKVDALSNKSLDSKINSVVSLKKNFTDKNFYYFSVPHKASALSHLYPEYDTSVEKHLDNENYLISNLNKNGISAYSMDSFFKSKFSKEELESMYYKTDHHWNAFGAYEATKEILSTLNIPFDESLYDIIEVNNKSIIGSYNRKLGSLFSKKETLSYIVPPNISNLNIFAYVNNTLQKVNTNTYLSSQRNLEEVSYGGFYHSDLPYMKIVNNESLTDNKILIIRDSYQAPTTSLFASIFKEVEIVDDRHTAKINKTLDDIIKESNADTIIYLKYL